MGGVQSLEEQKNDLGHNDNFAPNSETLNQHLESMERFQEDSNKKESQENEKIINSTFNQLVEDLEGKKINDVGSDMRSSLSDDVNLMTLLSEQSPPQPSHMPEVILTRNKKQKTTSKKSEYDEKMKNIEDNIEFWSNKRSAYQQNLDNGHGYASSINPLLEKIDRKLNHLVSKKIELENSRIKKRNSQDNLVSTY